MEATHKRARRSPPPPPSVLPSRDAEDIAPASTPNGNSNAPSRFNSIRSAKSKSSQPPGTPKSHHSRKSSKGASSLRLSSSESDSDSGSESESDDDEESDGGKGKKKIGGFRNRARSLTSSRKSDAGSQKNAGSRPPSRSSRKRADSAATLGKDKDGKEKDGKEKDKEKDKKKSSVSGWVSVLPGMGKSKKEREKEKERSKFEALMDDRDDMPSDGMGGDTEEDDGDLSADEEFGRRRPGSALSGSSKKSGDKDKGKKDKDEIEKKGKTTPAMTPSASPRISTRLIRTASNPPSPHGSPSLPNSSLSSSPKKNKQKRKVVVALYDFTASTSDELSFKSGDKIIVTNEVVDGWWMGEILTSSASNLDVSGVGRKGMFPTNYTKVLPERPSPPLSSFNSNNNNSHSNSNSSLSSVSSSSGLKPALSRIRTDENSVTGVGTNGSARSSLDGIIQFPNRIRGNTLTVKGPSTYPYPSPSASSSDRSFASTDDRPFKDGNTEDAHHPFSDQQQGYISSGRSPVNGHFYAESIGGSEVEELDDDRTHRYSDSSDFPVTFNSPLGSTEKEKDVVAQLTRRFSGPPPPVPPPITRRVTEATTTSGAAKRPPPPPPPPRRSTNNALSTPTLSSSLSTPTSTSTPLPYIPRRPPTAPGSSQSSTTSSFLNVAQAGVGKGKVAGLDGLDAQGLTHSPFDDLVGGVGNGCGNFKQNPFKQMGFCSNCFKMHP